MTAGAARPPPLDNTMAVPDVQYIVPPDGLYSTTPLDSSPLAVKRHKTLPRPRNGSINGVSVSGTPDSRRSSSGSTSHTLRHHRRSISGGDLPPTPPAHSRTSSVSQTTSLSNPSPLQTPTRSVEDVVSQKINSPTTPPNQRSPPTPEVTPPHQARVSRPLPLRPTIYDRIPSKSTTDSRTESFRTAPESPELSDNEDCQSPLRPAALSTRSSSQLTVRRDSGYSKKSQPLDSSPDCSQTSLHGQNDSTPKAKSVFTSFDGDWRPCGGIEQEWDETPSRNVTVRKRREKTKSATKRHGDREDSAIIPRNIAKSSRALPLRGRVLTYDGNESSRSSAGPQARSQESSPSADARRLSGMSSRSGASTVVEAILVEASVPRRQRTLRHVRRVDALRDSVWRSPPSSSPASPPENGARRQPLAQKRDAPRESYASGSTTTSISSRKARREVRRNGVIPIIIVPDRQSSDRSNSQDRSLRSPDSPKSKPGQSAKSVTPPQAAIQHKPSAYLDKPIERSRRSSESDDTTLDDQRTMDYSPSVVRRTSSLSASTSRDGSRERSRSGSRARSLTAESLRALDAANNADVTNQESSAPQPAIEKLLLEQTEHSAPVVALRPVSSPKYFALPPDQSIRRSNEVDREDRRQTADTFLSSPVWSTLATPFSQMSVETSATAAEISQATAVSIVAHQNRSVLVVNHRPPGSSDSSNGDYSSQHMQKPSRPTIITTEADGTTNTEQPTTPSDAQASESTDHVDSPLRNPRAPPQPPVLQFIPATPSGLTPAEEKPRLLGNFYEETREKPSRGMAIVRRALGNRRNSYGRSDSESRPGALIRRLSLGKNTRGESGETYRQGVDEETILGEQPVDSSRLHPEWQPYHYLDSDGDGALHGFDDGGDELIKYPVIDNRPCPPKRSLSQRIKRTFAIMPIQSQDGHEHDDYDADQRRLRKGRANGDVRGLKHQGSRDSLRRQRRRADTNPEMKRTPIFPRSYSLSRGSRKGRDSDDESQRNGLKRTWSLTQSLNGVSRRLSEKRREKRSNELRSKISGPQDVRDGVDEVIRRDGLRDAYNRSHRMEGSTYYHV